jgi:tRNA-binding EMAP/Myf-like protein
MILVMNTETAEDVDGSDNLRVYTFVVESLELVVVANRTNVYDVGDVVAVAQVGSTPEHFGNFEVTERKVFGIESFGMAVGVVDLPVGTILEDDWKPGE